MSADYILKAIKTGIQESLSQVKPDRTYIGNITKVLGDKEFIVNYDGNDRTIKTKYALPFAIGDIAHVTVPRDNIRNIYLIEDVAYGSVIEITGVSSVDGKRGNVVLENNYATKESEHTHDNKALLDLITTTLVEEWNSAYSHSISAHASSDAEKNMIIGIQKNGTDIAIDSDRKANIIVPTKISELANDADFIIDEVYVHTDNNYTTEEKEKLNELNGDDYGVSMSYVDSILSLLNKDGKVLKSVTVQSGTDGVMTVIGSEPTTKTENMIWIED